MWEKDHRAVATPAAKETGTVSEVDDGSVVRRFPAKQPTATSQTLEGVRWRTTFSKTPVIYADKLVFTRYAGAVTIVDVL